MWPERTQQRCALRTESKASFLQTKGSGRVQNSCQVSITTRKLEWLQKTTKMKSVMKRMVGIDMHTLVYSTTVM